MTPYNIVLLCDWLPPDFGAVGQYALSTARQLAASGRKVTLVGFASEDPGDEADGVGKGALTVRRVHRPSYDKSAWLRRASWTLRANLALIRASWRELRACDEIRFTGSPPYLLHFVMPVAFLLGKRTRYRITDFHPECLIAEVGREPLWLKAIKTVTTFWRRRVDLIEVLGMDQHRRIAESGVPDERIVLIRDPSPVAFVPSTHPASPPPELEGRSIVLYSGNWGLAHEVETFVDGFGLFCEQYPDKAGVWLNATGNRADLVQGLLAERGLPHARSKPVALEHLPNVLAAADVHLITLKDAFVGYVLPSKVYACVESGRPVLFVGSAESDVHLLCTERLPSSKYRRVSVGDSRGVMRALSELLAIHID